MSAGENERVVRRIFDAFARRDAFALRGLFAADAVLDRPGRQRHGRRVPRAGGDLPVPRPPAEGDGRHVPLGARGRARERRPRGRAVPRLGHAARRGPSTSTRCSSSGSKTAPSPRCSHSPPTRPRSRSSGPSDDARARHRQAGDPLPGDDLPRAAADPARPAPPAGRRHRDAAGARAGRCSTSSCRSPRS